MSARLPNESGSVLFGGGVARGAVVMAAAIALASGGSRTFAQMQPSLSESAARAEKMLGGGDLAGALKLYESGLRDQPDWPDGLWGSSYALYRQGRCVEARARLARLLRREAQSGRAAAVLGLCDFEDKDYAGARDNLQSARILGVPQALNLDLLVTHHLALALLMGAKYEAALQLLLSPSVRARPSEADIVAAGLAALRMQVLPADTQPSAGSRSIVRRAGLAHYYASHNQMEKAAAIYGELLSEAPRMPNLHHSWGSLLIGAGDWDAAAREFKEELALAPESVPARLGLAFLEMKHGNPKDGLRLAREACEREPGSFNARYLTGTSLLELDDAAGAVKELETARDLEPGSPLVHFTLARAYRMLGRPEDARRESEIFERLRGVQKKLRSDPVEPGGLRRP